MLIHVCPFISALLAIGHAERFSFVPLLIKSIYRSSLLSGTLFHYHLPSSMEASNDNQNEDFIDNDIHANILPASRSRSPSNRSPTEIVSEPTCNDNDPLALPIEQDLPRPFDNVSNALAALGALSIDDFLSNVTSSTTVFDVNFYVQLPETSISQEKGDNDREGEGDRGDEDGQTRAEEQRTMRNMVAKLHEASNKVFGSSDCLKFEYMEEDSKSGAFLPTWSFHFLLLLSHR